ncbi:M15 family metallopeptidase [Actinophytocola sp.]|uniref:M15 family metallopeptidase n=1 Tax=Actinophytocola sp. TaxID=1872138 RepID=UPI002ED3A937
MHRVLVPAAVLLGGVLAGCSNPPPAPPIPSSTTVPAGPTTTPAPKPPVWTVGASPLPLRPDGFGEVLPTPPELVNRALPTVDHLPPPAGDRYAASVAPLPTDVLARSTWQPSCPVTAGELRYLTMSFWGFDGHAHTGEMIVNARVADGVTNVFGNLFDARFPLEEMRVVTPAELAAAPTGDGNNTTAFVCRSAVGQRRWSAHAYGLAIDVNPFCNPYIRGDLVLPELASSYVDRVNARPGMIQPGDVVVHSFADIGWSWGGDWTTPVDFQHFSETGN